MDGSTLEPASTGLRLSTILGIVKQFGGHLWLDSVAGEGSGFSLAFAELEQLPTQTSEASE